jgi:hypothetical protein
MIKNYCPIFCSFTMLLGLLPSLAFPQQAKIDSLRSLFNHLKSDTSKVLILNELAFHFSISNPDSTLKYANEGLRFARELHFKVGEVKLLNRLADYHERQGNYTQAIAHARGRQGFRALYHQNPSGSNERRYKGRKSHKRRRYF